MAAALAASLAMSAALEACAPSNWLSPAHAEPAADETNKITRYCYEHGVVALSAGSFGNVIRVLMPLVITDAQFDEALDVLEAAIADALSAQRLTSPRRVHS